MTKMHYIIKMGWATMIIKEVCSFFIANLRLIKKHSFTKSGKASYNAEYGKHVHIGYNSIVTDGCSIGDFSYVNSNSSIEEASIGKYCSISSGVWINPSEHNIDKIFTSPVFGQGGTHKERVTIGNNVLISLNAIILSGVNIGDGSVIGAGSVVTKDVPPYSVVVGVPGRVIRYRFDQSTIRRLQNLYGDFYNDIDKMKSINMYM